MIPDAQGALNACLEREALALGVGNAESADTILRAARVRCDPERLALDTAWKAQPLYPIDYATRRATETKIQEGGATAEGLAVGALLAARARK